MKYINFLKTSLTVAAFACLGTLMTGCEEDVTILPLDKQAYDDVNAAQSMGFVKSAAGAKNLTTISFTEEEQGTGHLFFELSKAKTSDVTVSFKVDEAALTAYNQAHGTSYAMYPADKLSLTNEGSVTIPAGKRKSEMVELAIQPGGAVGTTYAVAVSAVASDGIVNSKNAGAYIYLVTPRAALPSTEKGSVRNICYVEVNNENILNVGEYTMEKSGKPFFDIVNIFAANIRINGEGKPYVHCNPQVMFVLDNADKLIRPLQQKGIKVHLTILGDHTAAGMRSLSDDAAKDFAKELKSFVDIYGLDGIDFDDEWSKYELVPNHPGFVEPSQQQYSRLIYECRKLMPKKSLSVYWCNGENAKPSVNYPKGDVEGETVSNLLSHTVFGNYNLWNTLDNVDKAKQCPYAVDASKAGFSVNPVFLPRLKNEGYGYFAVYNLKKEHDYTKKFNEIARMLYDDQIVWTKMVYGRTDFTPSRSTAVKDYYYYLGTWKVQARQKYQWNGNGWGFGFGNVNYEIRIEEKEKDKSYFVYGWAPYAEFLEKYPLTMEYTGDEAQPFKMTIPQVLHEPDAEDPLMWKMDWASPGDKASMWNKGGKDGEFRSFYNDFDQSYTLQPFPFRDNMRCTVVPFCSSDRGASWKYTLNVTELHPTGLDYEMKKVKK